MTKFTPLAALATAALIAIPVAGSAEDVANAEPLTKGEARLAKMLEGRTAGEPQSCISNYRNARLTVIDKTAYVYKVGSTLYVNVPADPDDIDDRETLVRRSTLSQLCKTDIITTVDLPNGFYTGNVFLGDFVPYRKDS